MLFLIEYDRLQGSIVQLQEFDDDSRVVAEDARLKLELDLNRQGIDHEVVLLDAPNEEALRHTHSRYFEESVASLIRSSAQIQVLLMSEDKSPLEFKR